MGFLLDQTAGTALMAHPEDMGAPLSFVPTSMTVIPGRYRYSMWVWRVEMEAMEALARAAVPEPMGEGRTFQTVGSEIADVEAITVVQAVQVVTRETAATPATEATVGPSL
ncbi:hypothetical protein QA635_39125 [Bradyrhizobium brasilense]|uniref:hypothetical protein n=1 Tax=Bradyrhizobium brasilense TaxID=1419277 RepID=UPI0024B03E50|nr:hypothetical protein [Bradyrhizobium australafricanum]WFU32425.1 hypothetical protein QA635_39125 [Bradyrhizobium australafricanum]